MKTLNDYKKENPNIKIYSLMDYEQQKIMVQENGYNIQHFKNPTEELQKLLIEQNGYVINFIKNPSEEVCLIAVEQDINNLRFIPAKYFEKQDRENKYIFKKKDDVPYSFLLSF